MAVVEATGVVFEAFFAVLPQRLEQPVPDRGRTALMRTIDLSTNEPSTSTISEASNSLVAAYRLSRGEVEATGEHRHTIEQQPFVFTEQ